MFTRLDRAHALLLTGNFAFVARWPGAPFEVLLTQWPCSCVCLFVCVCVFCVCVCLPACTRVAKTRPQWRGSATKLLRHLGPGESFGLRAPAAAASPNWRPPSFADTDTGAKESRARAFLARPGCQLLPGLSSRKLRPYSARRPLAPSAVGAHCLILFGVSSRWAAPSNRVTNTNTLSSAQTEFD